MIRINLLPYRKARRNQMVQKILAAWAGCAVFGVIVCLGVHSYMLAQVEEREAIKAENDQHMKVLDQQLGELKKLDEIKASLQKRLDVVAQLNKNRDLPARILDELSLTIPGKIWLTHLEVKADKINLQGFSESNAEIANFMINLGKSSLFSMVELGKSSDEMVNGISIKSFEMNFGVKPPS